MIDGITKRKSLQMVLSNNFLKHAVWFYSDFQSLRSNLIHALQLEKFFIHFFWLNLSPQIETKISPTFFFAAPPWCLGPWSTHIFLDAMTTVGLGGSPYASKSSWYPSFWFGSFGKSGHGRRQLRGSLSATAPNANAHVPCVFFSLVALIRGAVFLDDFLGLAKLSGCS